MRTPSAARPPHRHAIARRLARWTALLARLERGSARLAWARLALAAAGAAALVVALRVDASRETALAALGASALAWLSLLPWHARVHRRRDAVRGLVEVLGREELRADGRWREVPPPSRDLEAEDAALARDLDLLGQGSLMHLVSRCATPFGERALARALTRGLPDERLEDVQGAVHELRPRHAARQRVEAAGRSAGRQGAAPPQDFLPLLSASPLHDLHGRAPWLAPAAALLSTATVAQVLLAIFTTLPTAASAFVVAQALVVALTRSRVTAEIAPLLARERGTLAWSRMLREMGRARFRGALLRGLRDGDLRGEEAARAMHRLERILDALALRFNAFHVVIDVLVLWDLQQSARLARWRRRHGARASAWFDALGTFERCSSLAAHAAASGAEDLAIVEASGPPFAAEGIVHPLLPPGRAVPNDVELATGGVLLLTGSNMAGKSTLLRAIGSGAVLALAGGAPTAARIRMRPCRVLTSIAVTDALEEGTSTFLAEVRRLKAILDQVERADASSEALPALFLVDEILRGTNSRERLVAARSVIARLARSRSAGLVTSHDLSLTELEASVPGVRNAHLREGVDDGRLTFDYVLRSGPVTTTNALAVLRLEGIEIDEP